MVDTRPLFPSPSWPTLAYRNMKTLRCMFPFLALQSSYEILSQAIYSLLHWVPLLPPFLFVAFTQIIILTLYVANAWVSSWKAFCVTYFECLYYPLWTSNVFLYLNQLYITFTFNMWNDTSDLCTKVTEVGIVQLSQFSIQQAERRQC